ncbi:MAG TPA: FxsA family protein [Solirubrobacterales bacterium]|nr:FxsA family protein [Solirubrobacterales bacterium]
MALFLVLLFIVLPIAELYVIIKVGEAIGVLPTIALLIADSFLGAALLRSQGRAAWRRFNDALASGRVPAREVFDGTMIILGGAFLLTPGFITDVIGLVLLIPPTRALFRGMVTRMARRRAAFGIRAVRFGYGAGPDRPYDARRPDNYDYEGSAREVTDPRGELPPDPDDGRR